MITIIKIFGSNNKDIGMLIRRVFVEIRMGIETGYDIVNGRVTYGGIEFDFIGWSK